MTEEQHELNQLVARFRIRNQADCRTITKRASSLSGELSIKRYVQAAGRMLRAHGLLHDGEPYYV